MCSTKITKTIELGAFSYLIKFKSGKENVAADTFSNVCASVSLRSSLIHFHEYLQHSGITWLMHIVHSKNLPFSFSDVKQLCSQVSPFREECAN